MNEDMTRKALIDKAMQKAGWKVGKTEKHDAREEFVVPMPGGKNQFVDYTLMHNGKILAVVEAKRINRGVEEAKEQALQYADNVQAYVQPSEPTPFIFYTNGHDLYFWDSEGGYPPRKISRDA